MKKTGILLLITLLSFAAYAQKYQTKTGNITFASGDKKKETIKAENRKVVSVMDSTTGALEFSLLMKAFDFTNNVMEEHFNESYAESDKFPKATFKGSITDRSKVNFSKDGTYTVNISGKLTIKDVTKDITTTATFVVKGGKITATSKIDIKPKEYNFKIPAIAENSISEVFNIVIVMNFTKK